MSMKEIELRDKDKDKKKHHTHTDLQVFNFSALHSAALCDNKSHIRGRQTIISGESDTI